MNNQQFPFNLFPNGIPQNNNQGPNPFLNMMQNNPFLNNLNNFNNFQQPQPQPQPELNNIFQDMFSGMVDKNMVNSVFANLITSKIFPMGLHEPERTLDLLLYLSEKTFLQELKDDNKLEFQEFINMFRTSENKYPERKLAMFLNLLNYYTTKGNVNINQESNVNIDDFEPEIQPVD
tara:strand:- start:1058 stop:1588 length:531 start_codon:yes stop_codon:yes gene_type:complete